MLTDLTAPAAVSSLAVGTLFFVNIGGLTDLAIVYGSESNPEQPKGYAALFDQRDGCHRLYDLEDLAAVAQPIFAARFLSDLADSGTNSGFTATPPSTGLAVSNAAGCWVPVNGMWLNLNTGVMTARRPQAPWIELRNIQIRAADGEVALQISRTVPSSDALAA